MNLQFNLAVTNRGPSVAANTMVHYDLPANLTFLSATNLQGTISNSAGAINWTLDRLAPGVQSHCHDRLSRRYPGRFHQSIHRARLLVDLNLADNSVALSNHIDPPLLSIGSGQRDRRFSLRHRHGVHGHLSGPSGRRFGGLFHGDGSATTELITLAPTARSSSAPAPPTPPIQGL